MEMHWWYWVLAIGGGILLGLVIGIFAMVAVSARRVAEANAEAARHRATAVPKKEPRRLLAPPPMIGEYTLRDWLVTYWRPTGKVPRQDVWASVVRDFYTAAAANDNIKRYFGEAITQGRFDQIQMHFLSALITVTHVGLYADVADRLAEQHKDLMIKPEDFDATTQILVQTLQKYGVPIDDILPALRKILVELRSRFVHGGVFAE